MLKVDSKVHIFCGVNDNVDEVHASSLELSGGVRMHKELHQLLKSVLFTILPFEVVHSFYYLNMATLYQTHSCQEFNNSNWCSTGKMETCTYVRIHASMGQVSPVGSIKHRKSHASNGIRVLHNCCKSMLKHTHSHVLIHVLLSAHSIVHEGFQTKHTDVDIRGIGCSLKTSRCSCPLHLGTR